MGFASVHVDVCGAYSHLGEVSILFHGGIAGHFFTAPCQITQYAEPDFAFRCADKLFLTQLFVGTLAYSCGGFIYRIVTCRTSRPAKSACAKLS